MCKAAHMWMFMCVCVCLYVCMYVCVCVWGGGKVRKEGVKKGVMYGFMSGSKKKKSNTLSSPS